MYDWIDYANAWNYRDMNDFRTGFKSGDAKFRSANSPGVQIMKSLGKILQQGDSEADRVESLFRTFVEYAQESQWKWLGATPCNNPRVLDKADAQVECQGFVIGMQALMFYPPPFGLGIAKSSCIVRSYSPKLGSEYSGFIARHTAGGVMGLMANIKTPEEIDKKLFSGSYYFWANHKVLEYGGRIFDPSYGRVYSSIEAMVALSIEDYAVEGALGKAATLTAFEGEAENDETGKYYYLCQARGTTNRYKVRYLKKSQRATGYTYHGPYSIDGTDEKEYEIKLL